MRIDQNQLDAARSGEEGLVPTPGQTIGPFFGYADGYEQVHLPFRDGNHLVNPARPDAVRLTGTVYDGNGDPIPDAMLEIWQADAEGNIPQETGSLVRDGWTFTGWGRATVDNVGTYTFSTVNPGPTEEGKAAFIHLVVFARGLLNKLHTRIYLPEDTEALEKDALLSSVDADRRGTLIAERQADGSLLFDVHLQGEKETVFLQFPGIEYPDHA
ncbi:protocatechuate 3,4-dioxygenase subunit alpha [Citricoccus sp. SGAir0253]|uniref:protocatechuate 3,4-dioxygenase subunit alpha n=1 Tax=Citricoccus sp. SGAir0253 TaxID=2567881 RepID=UPI0010CCE47A|nr:protocatechuate 3,4-dioxygenase subunit alpha [Citricoccus sp. SGAir0253]QCU77064.1 protocatechuate 3,4-dioxygenase subunit alpha [Citricoccus sp. SGAir0253]